VAKDQALKLEILSVKHPGLLRKVDDMFSNFATRLQVVEMIKREYHEDAGMSAVSNYKLTHWNVEQKQIQEQTTAMRAFAKVVGEDGLEAGVNALLWQSLQTMKPTLLIALKRALNDDKKVALLKKRFALYAQEHRQVMKERQAMLTAGEEASTPVDAAEDYTRAQRVVQQVKEIFGIGMTPIEPPYPPRLNAGDAANSQAPADSTAAEGKP